MTPADAPSDTLSFKATASSSPALKMKYTQLTPRLAYVLKDISVSTAPAVNAWPTKSTTLSLRPVTLSLLLIVDSMSIIMKTAVSVRSDT